MSSPRSLSSRRVEADREIEALEPEAPEAGDALRQAESAACDIVLRKRGAGFVEEDGEGPRQAFEIVERLAHAHEDDLANVPAQGQTGHCVLAHDLLGPEVPHQAPPAGLAEDAAHAAAHLGGDAKGGRPRFGDSACYGDADAFDPLAVVEPEEGLSGRPEGPLLLDDVLDGGQPERDAGGQGGGGLLGDGL